MNNSYELLEKLKTLGYITYRNEALWWPRAGTFWVVVGAILTQQAKWEKVEKSIENLEARGINSLLDLANLSRDELAILIKPSGFYNTKAKNLNLLARNMVKDFGTFENFCESVSRDWLLSQKGIGEESADSILCYGCKREEMVADAYTARLLSGFGYEFESYEELSSWLKNGLNENYSKVEQLYGKIISLNELYARFHGKIVEYCKDNSKGKVVSVEKLI